MRSLLNSVTTVAVAFFGLATQAYGQPHSPNLGRERYEPADSSPPPAWVPYAVLGLVGVIGVAASACWCAQRTGCLNRFFPLRDQGNSDSDSDRATVTSTSDAERSLLDSQRSVP